MNGEEGEEICMRGKEIDGWKLYADMAWWA
jgi:hypothetical protein